MGNKTNIKKKKIIKKQNNKTKKNEKNFNTNYINKNMNEKILVQDSFSRLWLDNSFCVFNSINNILFLIYVNEKNFIISYNLIDEKKLNEIKKCS